MVRGLTQSEGQIPACDVDERIALHSEQSSEPQGMSVRR